VLRHGDVLCAATDSEQMIRRRQLLSVYWSETFEAELARYPSIARLRPELCEAGFVRLGQREVASRGAANRSRAYIGQRSFHACTLYPKKSTSMA
jgi:hypothetical protein